MSSSNTLPPKVEFLQNHVPSLDSGDYKITVTQTFSAKGVPTAPFGIPKIVQNFSVFGPRFIINPADIITKFPSPGSTGEYFNILPHIVLDRSTLPWERYADEGESHDTLPWMVLLLFDESELEQVERTIVPASTLNKATENPYFPGLNAEKEEKLKDKVSVIDVPVSLLKTVMPKPGDLYYLAHVRQGKNWYDQEEGKEAAVVVCNRLPKLGNRSVMHLVSIEQRWKFNGTTEVGFDYAGKTGSDQIKLISLASWDFYSSEHFKITDSKLAPLITKKTISASEAASLKTSSYFDQETVMSYDNFGAAIATLLSKNWISPKVGTGTSNDPGVLAILKATKYEKTLEGLLTHLNQELMTLQLPTTGHAAVDGFLESGSVPLKQRFRNGDQSYSWYHGPLVPAAGTFQTLTAPVLHADALLEYHPSQGMFDISYAAAWQLGRLLSLRDKSFSVKLYHYKRNFALMQKAEIPGHLPKPSGSGTEGSHSNKAQLLRWLRRLNCLDNVPFNYLVPDEKMLPVESIRFFKVDPYWMACLLDGAFSIGRTTNGDHTLDQELAVDLRVLSSELPIANMSGFLMRSEAVDGWPHLLVDGYDTTEPPAVDLHSFTVSNIATTSMDHLSDSPPVVDPALLALINKGIDQNFPEGHTITTNRIEILATKGGSAVSWMLLDTNQKQGYYLKKSGSNNLKISVVPYQLTVPVTSTGEAEKWIDDLNWNVLPETVNDNLPVKLSNAEVYVLENDSAWMIVEWSKQIKYLIRKTNNDKGYTTFQISDAGNRLPLLRAIRLSDQVLFCLFAGEVKAVDIHQKPETIHYGLNQGGTTNLNELTKTLKNAQGEESYSGKGHTTPTASLSFNSDVSSNPNSVLLNSNGVLDINSGNNSLVALMKKQLIAKAAQLAFTPLDFSNVGYLEAVFPMEMIEGVVKVRFKQE
ncbi:MAG: hypothetical protein AAFZ15_23125 [Bacteroidota bacterium]